jgi:hypothetical protein
MPEETRVCELMDPNTNGWNLLLISELFNEDDARVVGNIPLTPLSKHRTN